MKNTSSNNFRPRRYIEVIAIVCRAQEALDPVNRLRRMTDMELGTAVRGYLSDLDEWWGRWGDWLDSATRTVDDRSRSRCPLRACARARLAPRTPLTGLSADHARFFILSLALPSSPSISVMLSDPMRLSFAIEAVREGLRNLDVAAASRWHADSPFASECLSMLNRHA